MWYQKGKKPIIKTTGERKKKSFYGALNLKTGKVHIHVSKWENQEETVVFLRKLRQKYPKRKILLLWDGAPWHKGDRIRQYLRRTKKLELVRFPPYSPELNPQEHVWKEARTKISHNHEITNFDNLVTKFKGYLIKMNFKSSFLEKYL